MARNSLEIPVEQLRWRCNPEGFRFRTTVEISPLSGFIGQERAIRAIEFGLGMDSSGYNIYVAGLTGTGKTSIIKSHLERVVERRCIDDQCKEPSDWCYVNNFDDSDRPVVLRLPKGRAKKFKLEMDELIKHVKTEVSRVFESEEYAQQRKRILEESQKKQHQLFQELERRANEQGFTIQSSPMGLMIIPIKAGKPMTPEEYLALDQAEREELEQRRMELMSRLSDSMKSIQAFEREARKNVQELDTKVGQFTVDPLVQGLELEYSDFPEVLVYLKAVKADILDSLDSFRTTGEAAQQAIPPGMAQEPSNKYKVNLLVDNTDTQGLPIIIETNPTHANMFGRIEKRSVFGTYVTDFTMIRPGAVSRANGG
ncbi:MAG: AAA family ATPase, partial [Candidatus Tectomicrobia bacterium]|nr:AAA family ATPase [Candidatus Tectomicrobia bacterium]